MEFFGTAESMFLLTSLRGPEEQTLQLWKTIMIEHAHKSKYTLLPSACCFCIDIEARTRGAPERSAKAIELHFQKMDQQCAFDDLLRIVICPQTLQAVGVYGQTELNPSLTMTMPHSALAM